MDDNAPGLRTQGSPSGPGIGPSRAIPAWAIPAATALAYLLPGFFAGGPSPLQADALLSAAALRASHAVFLIVIIGLTGPFAEFGLSKPRFPDLARAFGWAAAALIVALATGMAATLARELAAWAAGSATSVAPGSDASATELMVGGLSGAAREAPGRTALFVALFCLAVGYREELFYRGYAIRSMLSLGAGDTAAWALSSLLFAAGHAYQGPAGMLSSGLIGLVFGRAFLKGGSLHALAWAHALFDFLLFAGALGYFGGA
jgi:hypothetical protein